MLTILGTIDILTHGQLLMVIHADLGWTPSEKPALFPAIGPGGILRAVWPRSHQGQNAQVCCPAKTRESMVQRPLVTQFIKNVMLFPQEKMEKDPEMAEIVLCKVLECKVSGWYFPDAWYISIYVCHCRDGESFQAVSPFEPPDHRRTASGFLSKIRLGRR